MGIEQKVIDVLRHLPPEKQQEVLDFVQGLAKKPEDKPPLKSVKGLCANLGFDITTEDIDEARKEMWGNFPREDIWPQ